MKPRRPLPLILALILFALLTVFGLITPLGHSVRGVTQPPLVVALYVFIVTGVGGLIALVGLWMLKRWGWWLSSSIAALTMLVTGPGLWLGRATGEKVLSGVLLVVNALVLVLVVLPATRKAVAAARTPAAQV